MLTKKPNGSLKGHKSCIKQKGIFRACKSGKIESFKEQDKEGLNSVQIGSNRYVYKFCIKI